MENLELIDALYELLDLAKLGRDQIKNEVERDVQGTLFEARDVVDANKAIKKAEKLASEFYA